MKPLVSIIMGSTSDLPVMEKACKWLNDNQIPFEVNALSAHRTPDAVESFAKGAKERGVKVIIAAAGDFAACRYGCRPSWCYRSIYSSASNRRAYQGYARWS